MNISPPDFNPSSNDHLLLAYVADLELEVDRLRKQGQFVRHAVCDQITSIRTSLAGAQWPTELSQGVVRAVEERSAVMHDLKDSPAITRPTTR